MQYSNPGIACTMFHLYWIVLLALRLVLCEPEVKGWNTTCFAYQRDLNILYLRSVSGTKSGNSVIKCDPENKLYGEYPVLVIEAFRYEIEKINARTDLLPNVSLGFVVEDICGQDLASMAAMLYAMPNAADQAKFPDDELITCEDGVKVFSNVIGAVGPSFSTAGVMVGAVSSLFEFPTVMTYTTSDELSDKTRFAYTMRLSPPDSFAAEAMIDLMIKFGWNYAAILYMEGSYGENGAKQVERQAKRKGFCIAFSEMLPSGSTEDDVEEVAIRLMRYTNVKVIVSYMFSTLVYMFETVFQRYDRGEYYMWMGSDSFPLSTNRVFFDGAIGIGFATDSDPIFQRHFEAINPVNTPDNPWLKYFWELRHDCQWNQSYGARSCQTLQYKPHGYSSESGSEGKTRDAVLVFAHALHKLISEKCPSAFGNRKMVRECVNGRDLHAYMLNSSFHGFSGKIQFNEKGDFLGKYIFKQYQHAIEDTVAVAVWDKIDGSIEIFYDKMQWFSYRGNYSKKGDIPEAVCSNPCKIKEYYIQKELPCCWDCRSCRSNEIIVANKTNCELCPLLSWPDEQSATVCLRIEPDFLLWTSPLKMTLVIVTGVGLFSCLITAVIFIENKNVKLIKASSRQLMAIIMIGIILAYVTVVILLLYPSTVVCYFGRFGFNLSVSFIYAPLMIKTSRVYRIFSAGKRGKVRPPLTGTKAQLLMVAGSIILQVNITLVRCSN